MLDNLPDVSVTVSEFVDLLNETYEFAFPSIVITGELANLRVSKNRWVYFDLKDETASVKFFGTVQHLHATGPLENGMLLRVRGTPQMHNLYGFSVNVQYIVPAGEGSIRRAAQLLSAKLQSEGLFDDSRKRSIPYPPQRIGLITSAQSAAYADFVKILGARWSGLQIDMIDVQVQGEVAANQISSALERFNAMAKPPEVLVLIRGGGSADDLATWSTEQVARAVAASRVPTMVAIGHEVDICLAELVADRRASTPSNAAELLTPDKQVVLESLAATSERLYDAVSDHIYEARSGYQQVADNLRDTVLGLLEKNRAQLETTKQMFRVLSPHAALARGYAIVRDQLGRSIGGDLSTMESPKYTEVGDIVLIELLRAQLEARIISIHTIDEQPKTN